MKLPKFFTYTFLFGLVFVHMLFIIPIVQAESCAASDYRVYFDVQDPVTGQTLRQVPVNGHVLLYLQTNLPVGCSPYYTVLQDSAKFYLDTPSGPKNLDGTLQITQSKVAENNKQLTRIEYKLRWQVSGLTGLDGKAVQTGSEVQFQAIAYLSDRTSTSKPTPIKVTVGDKVIAPDKNNPNVGTPVDPQGREPQEPQGIFIGTDCKTLGEQYKKFTGEDAPSQHTQVCSTPGSYLNNMTKVYSVFASGFAVLMIMIAGIRYVMSAGNEEQVAKAKKTMLWAIIGFSVIMMSVAIVLVIGQIILGK